MSGATKTEHVSARLARVIAAQSPPVEPVETSRPVRSVKSMRAPDLSCAVDGSMPSDTVSTVVAPRVETSAPMRLLVTTHAKRLGMVEVRFIYERPGGAARVGKLCVPRRHWLTLYRRMLLWACGEGLCSLSLNEHASEYQYATHSRG